MFKIDDKKNIHITRGDIGTMNVKAKDQEGGEYEFKANDIVRFSIYEKGNMAKVIRQIEKTVESATTTVAINLTSEETRIGDIINKPVNYWYEIQLNPDTNPQTIVGYDIEGAKLFILYPEGAEQE